MHQLLVQLANITLLDLQLFEATTQSVVFHLKLLADLVQLLTLVLPEVILDIRAFKRFHLDSH